MGVCSAMGRLRALDKRLRAPFACIHQNLMMHHSPPITPTTLHYTRIHLSQNHTRLVKYFSRNHARSVWHPSCTRMTPHRPQSQTKLVRCRVNVAQMRLPRPDYGLGFQAFTLTVYSRYCVRTCSAMVGVPHGPFLPSLPKCRRLKRRT